MCTNGLLSRADAVFAPYNLFAGPSTSRDEFDKTQLNQCGRINGRDRRKFTKSPGLILDRKATRSVAGRTPAIKSSHPDHYMQ